MKYNLIDHKFKQNNSADYQLSILIGMDSLVYSVSELETNELLVLKSVDFSSTDNLNQKIEQLRYENLLDLLYRKVRIGMLYPQSVLVPARLFNEEERNTYMDELSIESHTGQVQDDHLESLALRVVYPPKSDLGKMLTQRFPTAEFYNSLTAFLHGCEKMISQKEEHNAFVYFFDRCFYISLFEKGRLLFCNTFDHQSASDVMYFILLAFDQYGVSAEKVRLRLAGKIVENSDIYKLLHRYVLDIGFLPCPDFIKVGKNFSSVPAHFFFPLHALPLCQ